MFGITTAEDMLEKAKLERENYRQHPNSNTIFNLFITIYHIQDYVTNGARRIKKRKANKIFRNKIEDHFGDLYVWMKFICNKQKHYTLNRYEDQLAMQRSARQISETGLIGGATLNSRAIGGGPYYFLSYKDKSYELGELADLLIAKWGRLLSN